MFQSWNRKFFSLILFFIGAGINGFSLNAAYRIRAFVIILAFFFLGTSIYSMVTRRVSAVPDHPGNEPYILLSELGCTKSDGEWLKDVSDKKQEVTSHSSLLAPVSITVWEYGKLEDGRQDVMWMSQSYYEVISESYTRKLADALRDASGSRFYKPVMNEISSESFDYLLYGDDKIIAQKGKK